MLYKNDAECCALIINKICNAFRFKDQIPIYMILMLLINISATSAMVVTSAKQMLPPCLSIWTFR